MKTRKKIYGFVAGIMLLLSIVVMRFGKHIKPRQAENVFEVIVETVDDLGKIQTITETLSVSADSLDRIDFLTCLNDLNFFNKSYASNFDGCYSKALNNANRNNPKFADVLIRAKNSLDELKDNHSFFIGIDRLLYKSVYVDFDSVWKQHFKRPSEIDLEYKPVLFKVYQSKSSTRKMLDSTAKKFEALDKLMEEHKTDGKN